MKTGMKTHIRQPLKYMRDYIKDASGIPKDIVKLFESIQRRQV